MTVGERTPGPIGARCCDCVYGPGDGQGVYIWLCRETWSVVRASDRACSGYTPRNGRVVEPFLPHQKGSER